MLVLTRKSNQSIMIGDDIMIMVVKIRGDTVRLGIEAPRDIPVHRREVYDEIHRQKTVSEPHVQQGDTESWESTKAPGAV